MTKKITSLLFAVLLLLSLAACGSAPAESTGSTTVQQNSPSTAESTAAPDATSQTDAQPVFEEISIVNNDICTFKITAIEEDSFWGYTLNAYIENKTDLDLMFSMSNVSVNGFMCDPFWASTITAGMKSNEEIRFLSEDFEVNGITTVTDITFTLEVYDNNDWSADHLISDVYTIYPRGEDAVEHTTREPQAGDIVLFDDENCTMIVTGFIPDSLLGYDVNVYLENKTDKTLMFSINGASVNGYMCDPLWATTVAPGKRANTAISWLASDLEENEITEVEVLTLPISVYDETDWNAAYFIDETFTVNP